MPFYHKLGEIPAKRHITFYKGDHKSLYREELVSTKGFSGIYSNKYHLHEPTKTLEIKELDKLSPYQWSEAPLMHMHLLTNRMQKTGDFVTGRNILIHNNHCTLSVAHVDKPSDYFYRNALAHEYLFIHHGSGVFYSEYGQIPFVPWDQIVIPKGTIYQIRFDQLSDNKILVIESDTPFEIPRHYRNEHGQLLEDAPFCERDLKIPQFMAPHDEKGEFPLHIKHGDRFFNYTLQYHPFDLTGWDGYLYPYAFNMKDFAPKVGQIHLPPPVHLVFTTDHFVVCNFCPRLFDFHPSAIPAPYFHSNVDSAEVLYYVEGEFMSRKGVGDGSITLHPMGLPHGPQPGKTEASIGKKETYEFAVMVDTFEQFYPAIEAKEIMDPQYYRSWLED